MWRPSGGWAGCVCDCVQHTGLYLRVCTWTSGRGRGHSLPALVCLPVSSDYSLNLGFLLTTATLSCVSWNGLNQLMLYPGLCGPQDSRHLLFGWWVWEKGIWEMLLLKEADLGLCSPPLQSSVKRGRPHMRAPAGSHVLLGQQGNDSSMFWDFYNMTFKILGQETVFQPLQSEIPTVMPHGLPTTSIRAAVSNLLSEPEAPVLTLSVGNQPPV